MRESGVAQNFWNCLFRRVLGYTCLTMSLGIPTGLEADVVPDNFEFVSPCLGSGFQMRTDCSN